MKLGSMESKGRGLLGVIATFITDFCADHHNNAQAPVSRVLQLKQNTGHFIGAWWEQVGRQRQTAAIRTQESQKPTSTSPQQGSLESGENFPSPTEARITVCAISSQRADDEVRLRGINRSWSKSDEGGNEELWREWGRWEDEKEEVGNKIMRSRNLLDAIVLRSFSEGFYKRSEIHLVWKVSVNLQRNALRKQNKLNFG